MMDAIKAHGESGGGGDAATIPHDYLQGRNRSVKLHCRWQVGSSRYDCLQITHLLQSHCNVII